MSDKVNVQKIRIALDGDVYRGKSANSTVPTDATTPLPTTAVTGWDAFGGISEAGVEITVETDQADYSLWNAEDVVRTVIKSRKRSIGFAVAESNDVVDYTRSLGGVWVPITANTGEIQTITEGGSGLTTFTLTYNGQTTSAIAAAATAATVQTALEALSNINVGDVAVSGSTSGPYTVTFTGPLAGANVAQMTATPTGGTGTVTIATTTQGTNQYELSLPDDGAVDEFPLVFDWVDGDYKQREYYPRCALANEPTRTHNKDGLLVYQFEVKVLKAPAGKARHTFKYDPTIAA